MKALYTYWFCQKITKQKIKIGLNILFVFGFQFLNTTASGQSTTTTLDFDFSSFNISYISATASDLTGNIYVTGLYDGRFSNDYDFDPESGVVNPWADNNDVYDEVFLAKYSNTGSLLWLVSSYTDGAIDFEVNDLITDASGNVYITGSVQDIGAFMLDTDLNNISLWGNHLSSTPLYGAYVIKFNSSGVREWVWNKYYGTSVTDIFGESVKLDASGNVLVTGYRINSASSRQGLIWKLDASGVEQSENVMTGSGAIFKDLDIDESGNLFVTGQFKNTVDFDPSGSTNNLIGNAAGDVFVAKYNSSFTYQWASRVTSNSDEEIGLQVALDASDNVFMLGKGSTDKSLLYKLSNVGSTLNNITLTASSSVSPQSLVLNAEDDVYISGFTSGSMDFDPTVGVSTGSGGFYAKYANDLSLDYKFTPGAASLYTGFSIAADGQLIFAFNDPIFPNPSVINRLLEYETVAPSLISHTPENNATGVSKNANLTLTFDETIYSINGGVFAIYRYDDNVLNRIINFQGGPINNTSIFTLSFNEFDYNTKYYVTVEPNTFKDLNNNAFVGFTDKDFWTFTTEPDPSVDSDPPGIASYFPTSGATGVSIQPGFSLIMDEPVYIVNGKSLEIREYNTDALITTVNTYTSGSLSTSWQLSEQISTQLDYATTYYVLVQEGAFKDASDNLLPAITNKNVWTFTTVLPDTQAPAIDDFEVPTDDALNLGLSPSNFYVSFDEQVYLVSGTAAVVTLKKSDGATVQVFTDEDIEASGFGMSIKHNLTLEPSSSYYITIGDGLIEDEAGNDYPGFTEPTIWNFSTRSRAVEDAHFITALSPSVNSENVSIDLGSVSITFHENISLGNGAVSLKKFAGNSTIKTWDLATSGEISATDNVLQLMGIPALASQTEYYLEAENGAPSEDASSMFYFGNSDERYTGWLSDFWHFTTQVEPFNLISLTPANGAINIDNTTNFTLSFNKNVGLGSGSINIFRSDNDNLVATLSNYNSLYMVISGVNITFDFVGDLQEGVEYYIQVSDSYLRNASNASDIWSGIQDKTSWTFTTKQTITWNGTSWSNGTGPTSMDDAVINGNYSITNNGAFEVKDLTINTGQTLTIEDGNYLTIKGNLYNNGNMTVESGASLITFDANSITGNDITFKRNTRYSDGKYSFVGSPVMQNFSIIGSDLGSYVYKYDETVAYGANDGLNRWKDASAEMLIPGKGYSQALLQEIVFVGKPNAGTVTYTGTYTEDVDNGYEGWNLVSNPYPAAIEVADFLMLNSNLEGAVYIWDDNGSATSRGSNSDYIVANGSVATNTTPAGGQSRYNLALGSSQGFFVKLNSSVSTEIVFNEDMRVTGQNLDDNFFRKTEDELSYIRINLTNQEGLFKQTIVGWLQDISDTEVDRRFDAKVFDAKSDYSIYTIKANTPLAIQGITSQKEEVTLGLNVAESGTYSIEIDLENYKGQFVYLKDNFTGKTMDLTSGVYSFSSNAGQFTNRFTLRTLSRVLTLEDQKTDIYAFNKILHIKNTGSQPAQYQIYNLSGVRVMKAFVNGSTQIDLNHLNNSIYIVSDGIESKKIILK